MRGGKTIDTAKIVADRAGLIPVAKKACAPEECIHNEAGLITPDKVLNAIIAADALGRARTADKGQEIRRCLGLGRGAFALHLGYSL